MLVNGQEILRESLEILKKNLERSGAIVTIVEIDSSNIRLQVSSLSNLQQINALIKDLRLELCWRNPILNFTE